MRFRSLLFAGLAVALAAPLARAADEKAPLAVGAPITVQKAANLGALAKSPAKFEGQTVRLEGTVKAVCQGSGCWVEVMDRKGKSFLAKSLDESVLLPKDCVGRAIVVQGVVTKLTPKAQEHAHAEGEAAGHACPAPVFLVSTQGAQLK